MKKFFKILFKIFLWIGGILIGTFIAGMVFLYFTFGKNSGEEKGGMAIKRFNKDFAEATCDPKEVFHYWRCNGFPCDPSMFYKFQANETCVQSMIKAYHLQELNPDAKEFKFKGISFSQVTINKKWWNPKELSGYKYYEGYVKEKNNTYHLMFDKDYKIYLYVQNY